MNTTGKKTGKTIERIFVAAVELLGEKGYAGATMDEIIASAGVSKGSVYWHFKSKRELFIELFEYWMRDFAADYNPIFEGTAPPKEKLQELIDISGNILKERPEGAKIYLEFMNLAIKDHGFVERLLIVFEAYKLEIKSIIETGIKSGDFNAIDAGRTAELLISTLDGLLLRACVDPDYPLDSALQFVSTFVFRALGCENKEVRK